MIQRVQSLYLLISAIAMAGSLAMPFLLFSLPGTDITLYAFSIVDSSALLFSETAPFYTLGVSIVLTAILPLITIFLYSKRSLQMRITIYGIILKLAIVAVVGYVWYMLTDVEPQFKTMPQIGVLCIAIAIVLDWLAFTGIKKDDALVKSVDRIR